MAKTSTSTTKKTKTPKTKNVTTETTTVAPAQEANSENSIKVDVEYLKTTKLHFAIPCSSGSVSEATFMSFVKFGNVARQVGLEWSVETVINEPSLARARNTLLAKFLSSDDKTHIMFVDPDIGFEPWHVLVMIDRKVDAISGLYSLKALPIRWIVSTFEGAEETEDGLHEVDRVGCNFMLLSRGAITKLSAHDEVKSYANDMVVDEKIDANLKTYFSTSIKNNTFYTEDWNFCDIYRSTGSKMYVDKRVLLSNKGQFTYSANSQDFLINSLGPVYMDFMKTSGKIQVIETAPIEAPLQK